MEDNIFDKVHEVDLEKTMKESYIDYAMSVIASRALPDVRDGLKPVQRRVLYSMIELNNGPDKPHRKCARIVGDTMGKYHPHGDSSIYGALVNMAQEWSTRYPLVDGHGNFGSVDGDGAAAMRYTEARLSKISMEMLADINKDTVDFQPNFDETEREPVVLPARFPNLLVNGTTGIAVGMATNIPPHNLRETVNAVVKIIDNIVEEDRETAMEELLEIVKGLNVGEVFHVLARAHQHGADHARANRRAAAPLFIAGEFWSWLRPTPEQTTPQTRRVVMPGQVQGPTSRRSSRSARRVEWRRSVSGVPVSGWAAGSSMVVSSHANGPGRLRLIAICRALVEGPRVMACWS